MSVFGKIITTVFGKKSDKDIKELKPYVGLINSQYEKLQSLSDSELKDCFIEIKNKLKTNIVQEKENLLQEGLDESKIDAQLSLFEKEFLNEKMVEVFAIVKDVCRRLSGTRFDLMGQEALWEMIPYDVQLMGGIALHQGKVAEMKTGEGKTLVSTMPIVLNAITGRGLHVITVNDYLAERDSQWMGLVYRFLGLSFGCILSDMGKEQRQQMYSCDITYGTNSQFGFDYLRDNMTMQSNQQVQKNHYFAIVDEVDSVLIDEARTPLIISGEVNAPSNEKFTKWKYNVESIIKEQTKLVNKLIDEAENNEADKELVGKNLLMAQRGLPKNKSLLKIFQKEGMKQLAYKIESEYLRDKKLHELDEKLYFIIDEKSNVIDLSEMGREFLSPGDSDIFIIPDIGEIYNDIEMQKLDKSAEIKKKEEAQNLHSERSERILTINQLLKAYSLFEKDVDYIVQEGKVLIVDEHTGRVLHGRRFSDGLHQALESKENVIIEKETQTMATITIQNYFRMYEKLAGMTGTAITESEELMKIYKLDVVEIPTNKEIVRSDYDDQIYRSREEKFKAVVDKLIELFNAGQPVLVGTTSVEESELLSRMLKSKKIPHNVLNAKQHQREAEIVARAGQKSAITISTNMAGRGTDIKLSEEVVELGGLYILGTGRHESRRIDLQLRGRSGRQGDAGCSIFFLSLEDDLMRLFGSDRIAKVMDRLGLEEGEVITHSMVTKSIQRAQKKVEARNYSIRKHLLEYDDVMNQQREIIYDRRNFALHEENISSETLTVLNEFTAQLIDFYCNTKNYNDWDVEGLSAELIMVFSLDIKDKLIHLKSKGDFSKHIKDSANELLSNKENVLGVDLFNQFQRFIVLKTIDEKWREHLHGMDQLREGIGLRAYGQKNPLIEYKQEGFKMFSDMLYITNKETLKRIFRANLSKVSHPDIDTSNIRSPKNLKSSRTDLLKSIFSSPPNNSGSQSGPSSAPVPQGPNVKHAPVEVEKKTGRNEPCICGSGKKYKKCCG